MRKALGLAVVLAAVSARGLTAQAPEPLIGTWVLDVKASTYPPDAPRSVLPKTHSESYRLLPSGEIELTTATVYQDGSSSSGHVIFPAEGGAAKVLDASGRTAVQTQVGPNEWLTTQMIDGKQRVTIRKVISPDGRTRRDLVRGRAQDGHIYEDIEVFSRQ